MKLYKEDYLGMLSMADRLAYVRSLASKYNLKESIQNSYGKNNFYIGLSFSENYKMNTFYYDTTADLEYRSVIHRDMGSFNSPEYNYYIKISSKETLDNITESDYNDMIMNFKYKIKQYKIKNKIDAISKDFE